MIKYLAASTTDPWFSNAVLPWLRGHFYWALTSRFWREQLFASFIQRFCLQQWGIGDVHFQDGYRLIRAEQLVWALHALNEREISFRTFRAYIGCFELLARREAAERSGDRTTKTQRRFLKSELDILMGGGAGSSCARKLRCLKSSGLLTFSENTIETSSSTTTPIEELTLLGCRGGRRLVPVPRQVLKFIARCNRPALAKTIVAYLIRGLALNRDGTLRTAGTVKVSWICKLCRVSERAVRSARAELIRLGWITKDTGSFQRKLNRDGHTSSSTPRGGMPKNGLHPPVVEKCTGSAPPIERQETPYESKNQY